MTGLQTQLDERVAAHLHAFRSSLGPLLGAELEAFERRAGLDLDANPALHFSRVAQPVARLPLWVAEVADARGRPIPEPVVWAAVEAAVMGYLYAQVQDEIVDGPGGVPPAAMLLGHALFTRHQAALVPVAAGRPVFWRLYEAKWLAYGEALALERAVNRGDGDVDRACFERILGRSHPLVIPGAALLAHADLWELCPSLERLVQHSTMAAQLFDDAIDAPADLADGNRTWVVRRLGGAQGADALRRNLYAGGGLDEIVDEALAELRRAQEVAAALGMTAAERAFTLDARHMEDTCRAAARALAEQLFG
jgi:hypothetical protein